MEKLRERLTQRMADYFGTDEKRIRHANEVTGYVERILRWEKLADRDIVVASAILHDIGIHEAERKHGVPLGKYQEVEGPPLARDIMEREGLPEEMIDEVCTIIAHHHSPGVLDTVNFKVLYDADLIAALKSGEASRGRFLTEGGAELAESVLQRTSE